MKWLFSSHLRAFPRQTFAHNQCFDVLRHTGHIVILSFLILSGGFLHAGDHSFSMNFELTSTMINRALNQEYTSLGLGSVYQGSVPAALVSSYSLNLSLPHILLDQNSLRVVMGFSCNAVVSGQTVSYSFSVSPDLTISPSVITSSQVTAALLNLPDKLNTDPNLSSIPAWVKTLVTQYYNSLQLWMYPSKLIAEANSSSEWLLQRAMYLKSAEENGLTLSYSVTADKVAISLTCNIHAAKPYFSLNIGADEDQNDYLNVLANQKVKVVEFILTTQNGSVLFHLFPNQWCEKNAVTGLPLGVNRYKFSGSYIVKIQLETDDTFYMRQFPSVNIFQFTGASIYVNNQV